MSTISRRSLVKTGVAAAATAPLWGASSFAETGKLKVGFVYLTSVGDHGWTYAHDQGRKQIAETFGDKVEIKIVENVAEGPDSERVVRQLAQDGMDIIFTTSFGYMNPTLKVAKRFPKVKFEHATGYKRADNLATYNLRFYEGRAVCGTIAAHMSKSGVAGYIASFPIPEVVMGINAFTIAARKVNPKFETKVLWVSTWYDPAKESAAATTLLDQGADILAQHTDSPAALQAAEKRGAMAFGQAWDMSAFAPTAHLTAIQNNWGTYYVKRVQAAMDGNWATGDTWTGMKDDAILMTPYNKAMPAKVKTAADQVVASIKDGSLHPFAGPVKDADGKVMIKAGETPDDGFLNGMKWYAEGVLSS